MQGRVEGPAWTGRSPGLEPSGPPAGWRGWLRPEALGPPRPSGGVRARRSGKAVGNRPRSRPAARVFAACADRERCFVPKPGSARPDRQAASLERFSEGKGSTGGARLLTWRVQSPPRVSCYQISPCLSREDGFVLDRDVGLWYLRTERGN